ncbi:DUF3667 domain-containing protein [Aquimarina sp. 2201CG5-10]|uniref:DUF3667 domain-containing protein n=1 Tax=Aquimarina callyspongiae TaxID=3098150 RepID=UPI002AB3A401|nr:DUF3667 domain-containing protein [Aquimarina sp. 2201CG5-10]MDY8134374.1 DUF3667 domain-containing protein [Aquimarina sp. 2201CG5-10]
MSDLIVVNNCKNCGEQIESYNYCPHCGAKKITKRITSKHLFQEFTDRFLNIENSFFKTFIHLFTKPEEVIDGFVNGLRKRYLNPFSYFAISLTIAGLYTFILKRYKDEIFAQSFFSKDQIEISQMSSDFAFDYNSMITFLTLPFLALISRFIFLNYKKYNLTEHLVIHLYAYSHIAMILSFILLPFLLISKNIFWALLIQFPLPVLYIAYVLKRLYNLNFKQITIKTLLFTILMVILFIIFSIVMAIIMVKTGVMPSPSGNN